MGIPRDIYGEEHGPKRTALTREDVIAEARLHYPKCYIEASTGPMFTIWNNGDVIGSAWERKNRQWFYRLKLS